jgi:hypothetical protein
MGICFIFSTTVAFNFPILVIHQDILPKIHTENNFARLRYILLNRPTIHEYQIASRVAETIKNNPNEEINDPLVKARFITPTKNDFKSMKSLFTNYSIKHSNKLQL